MSFKSSCSSRKFPSVRVACNRCVGIMSGPCVDVWKSAFPSPQHEVLPAPGRSTRDDIMIIHPLTSVSMPTAGPRPRPRDTVRPTSSGTPQSHHAAGEDPPRNPRLHRRTPSGSPWPMHGLLDQGRTWIQDTDTRIPGGRCNGTPPGVLRAFEKTGPRTYVLWSRLRAGQVSLYPAYPVRGSRQRRTPPSANPGGSLTA